MTVCLGLMCVLLLVFITLYITITAERDLLKNTVEEFTHTINRLQDKNTDLMTEKDQLKNNVSSLSQKKLELETRVMSLKEELKREVSKQGFFFISSESMSWPESRQYCTDRGADLVIINTEEKQRCITSLAKERVWIGLTDSDTEGIMKWVDKSPLKQGFWFKGEPNNYTVNEDCVEVMPTKDPVNNWNDHSCSEKRKGICVVAKFPSILPTTTRMAPVHSFGGRKRHLPLS
ncbi:C-type lectin domain family 4 member E-like [Pimephales promelas]|uniref:C-type lectin domain family 4 member E-like n=1 Tax=Pimephales promelas TaxID=90988 RepID=UPI0019555948|nr:C-type lectin domain family 4 member E-like [Pimephales promelas]